jgi:subtilisin family serine protease
MLGDDGFSWSGLARWSAATENNTATWPSTADSAIGVAAYKSKLNNTDINTFSGRGTRIDGARIVDVAAPGSTVYSIGLNTTYVGFGGTSSAGPHVAGAAALILQADSTLRHRDVQRLLQLGAIADQYTGTVPNTTWGFGKLRIDNSISLATAVPEQQSIPSSSFLIQNYPNPFNPTTTIEIRVPERQLVQLKIYDLLGREVATLLQKSMSPGVYQLPFDASRLASGIYVSVLQVGQAVMSRKMVLIK